MFVVLHHAWLQTWPKPIYGDAPTGLTLALTGWLEFGRSAVTFFIAISGFCLMLPVLRNEGTLGPEGARGFFYRRARRILPPYYAALLLSIVLVAWLIADHTHSLYDASLPMTNIGIVSHLLLLHNVHVSTASQICGPLWSIAVECQIYLWFPLLIAMRRRLGMLVVLAATFFVGIILLGPLEATPYRELTPEFLFIFALGMYAAEAALGPRKHIFIWIGCGAAMLMLYMFHDPDLSKLVFTDVSEGVVCACLLIVCAHWPRNAIARVVCWQPIASLGLFSYSLYLIHFPLQQVLWQHVVLPMKLGPVKTFYFMATAGTALIVILSYLFYLVFERPFCGANGGWTALVSRYLRRTPKIIAVSPE